MTMQAPDCPECAQRWRRDHRLTCSPRGLTVWVEPDQLWIQIRHSVENPDATSPDGWMRQDKAEWESLKAFVDRCFAHLGTAE
jgi:hypothetical protein